MMAGPRKVRKKYRLIWLFSALNCAAKNSSNLQRQLFMHNSSYNCQTGLEADHNWMKFFLMEHSLYFNFPCFCENFRPTKVQKLLEKKL